MNDASRRLLEGTDPVLLLALPALALFQLALQLTIGFGNGPVFEIARSAMLLGAYALFYLLVRQAAADTASVRVLLGFLALIGGLEAGYALLNLLSGNHYLLVYQRTAYLDSATGTLISRNHFAVLMELLLPAALAFTAMFGAREHEEPGERAARLAFVGTAIVTLALALIFSQSRMGVASFLLATFGLLFLNRRLRPDAGSEGRAGRTRAVIGTLIVVSIVGFTLIIGLDPALERFFHVQQDLESGRWPIWKATLSMIGDRPLLGNGFGSFEALLPGHRPAPTGFFYNHAHNEYLEFLAEGGVVAFAVVAGLLLAFGRRLVVTLSSPLTPLQRTVIVWLAVAIASVLLHSAADFGLRVPGVAFTFVYIGALFSRVTEDPSLIDRHHSRGHHRPPDGRSRR